MRIPPSLFLSLVLFGPHLLGLAWARESDLLGLVNRWRVLASPADVPMADWRSGPSAGLVVRSGAGLMVRSGALTLDCWCALGLRRPQTPSRRSSWSARCTLGPQGLPGGSFSKKNFSSSGYPWACGRPRFVGCSWGCVAFLDRLGVPGDAWPFSTCQGSCGCRASRVRVSSK